MQTYSEMSVGKVFWLSILRSVKLWILYFHASLIWKTLFWWVSLVLQCHNTYMTLKIKFSLILCSESFSITHIENYFWGLSDCSSIFFFHHLFHALHLFVCGVFFIYVRIVLKNNNNQNKTEKSRLIAGQENIIYFFQRPYQGMNHSWFPSLIN